MKRVRWMMAWVLVALMVIEPFALNMAAWAEEAANADAASASVSAQEGSSQVKDASGVLDNTKEAKKKWYMGSGTKKNIDNANQNLRDAKGQVNSVKGTAQEAAGSVKEIGSAAKGEGSTFEKLTAVKAAAQKALIKIGQLLQKIGQLLKTVGNALVAVGTALQAIPWTSAIGSALVNVGKILIKVGTALDYAGKAIEKVGQTAANTDQKFSDIIGQITSAGKTGWAEGGKAADKAASDAAAKQAENKADTTKDVEQGTTSTQSQDSGEVTKPAQASDEE
ncbi:MAG TPA: hypothetical protein VIV61_07365 [Candidatus Ozemobacteraceae bacterium]